MKQLVIIGAGGMGRTMFDMARESWGHETEFVVKGFIDDNVKALNGFEGLSSYCRNYIRLFTLRR